MSWSALASFGGSVLQGLGNWRQASMNRDFNAQQAAINRSWQTGMSNSAVSRRMADMKRAGINPILAARYDATTPGGSALGASSLPSLPNIGEASAQGAKIGAETARTKAEEALKNAQTTLQEALVPGAQAVETITSNVLELLEAAEASIKDVTGSNKEILSKLQLMATDLMEKIGTQAPQVINNVKLFLNEAGEAGGERIELFKNWMEKQ